MSTELNGNIINTANASSPTSQSYSFVPGLKHTITDAPVDPQFCDPSSPLSFSGTVQTTGSKYVDKNRTKNLFFWFFEKRRYSSDTSSSSDSTTPLVIWLTGGPGCSSTLALLVENGPCSVNPAGDGTMPNPYSWNEAAHVLWLDQPAGVGYSYGEENDDNERMVGEDVYYFLQTFFRAHPEYLEGLQLHVVGESYGGHYAPAIAHRILKGNREGKDGTVLIDLQGLAVGNGLTNPSVQYQHYAEMAYNNSHHIKTIRKIKYEAMTNAIPGCTKLIKRCTKSLTRTGQSFWCLEALDYCNLYEIEPYTNTGLNPYNIELKCGDNPLCYNFTNVDTFLNLNSTRQALHATGKNGRWYACNGYTHWQFTNDWMTDLSPRVADLLEAGVPVLIYAGDLDFICNYKGNEAWTYELEWKYGDDFRSAGVHEWDGKGLVRSAKGFTFLQVYDAGHMVPMDQPKVALEMITMFLEGGHF